MMEPETPDRGKALSHAMNRAMEEVEQMEELTYTEKRKLEPSLYWAIGTLRRVHEFQAERFRQKYGRIPNFADINLLFEREKAELLKVEEGKGEDEDPFLIELWDCVFSMIAQSLSPEQGRQFTDQEIVEAFFTTIRKISARAGFLALDVKRPEFAEDESVKEDDS